MDPAADLAAQLNSLTGSEAYFSAAADMLSKLFPSNVVSRISFDKGQRTSQIRSQPQDHPFGHQAEKLIDVYADHPLRVNLLDETLPGAWVPRRLSDVATDLQLYGTRAFHDGLRPRESNRELSLLCRWARHRGYEGWGINRWNVDFTDREVELAAHIQPMLRLLDVAYAASGSPLDLVSRGEQHSLTARESEVLQLLSQGLTAVAIGHLLGISGRTVAKHLEHAYAKLGCTNRIDALRILRDG
jgi:DNA-binding CsgD family transcriptional regulator